MLTRGSSTSREKCEYSIHATEVTRTNRDTDETSTPSHSKRVEEQLKDIGSQTESKRMQVSCSRLQSRCSAIGSDSLLSSRYAIRSSSYSNRLNNSRPLQQALEREG